MENVSKNVPGLGTRLGQSRTNMEISQGAMAEYIGMSRPNYTAIENEHEGRFLKDYQLKNLAVKLNVSSDYLLGLIDDPNPNADIMAITKRLGISSESVYKILSFSNEYRSSEIIATFDSFMESFNKEFWELIRLYKDMRKLYNDKFSFVEQFTKDIYFERAGFYQRNVDVDSCYMDTKYYYVDRESAKEFYKISGEIMNDPSGSIDDKIHKIWELLEKGEICEDFLHVYKEVEKSEVFKNDLLRVKNVLDELTMLVDRDETSLIFAFYKKENDINNIIDKIIKLIDTKSNDSIDKLIEDLWADLEGFKQTVDYAFNFVKFRINELFGNFLDEVV